MKNQAEMATRLRIIEKMVVEIYGVIVGATRIDGVDESAYRRAISELARGNVAPLDDYMKRGGKVPINGRVTEGEAA